MSKEEFLKEYVPKTESLLKNYKEYMAMIENDVLDTKKRNNIALYLKKVNNALEVLSKKDKQLIELRYLNNTSWAEVADILGCHVTHVFYIRKRILKTITPIIFVAELAYEEKSGVN